jgi:hypothetical protein
LSGPDVAAEAATYKGTFTHHFSLHPLATSALAVTSVSRAVVKPIERRLKATPRRIDYA